MIAHATHVVTVVSQTCVRRDMCANSQNECQNHLMFKTDETKKFSHH